MSRLTLRLPETLHQKLVNMAKSEGVSLNQYIVYALSCQIHNNYTVDSLSKEEVEEQKQLFDNLVANLGTLEEDQVKNILNQREKVPFEDQLPADIKAKFELGC
jgi:hypothetical protein